MAARDDEVEIRDVAPGLWLWRQRHWEWREGDDWEPEVSSWVVESRGETLILDPLAPAPSARSARAGGLVGAGRSEDPAEGREDSVL